ncbi:MAG: L-aspartate oxidase [Pseudomonadota bacterium]
MTDNLNYDVLIFGSGAAGLTLALNLAQERKVAVLTKSDLQECSTYYAQGGISAVLDGDDSFESHIEDTLDAGAGLCDPDVVRFTVERGPGSIEWLQRLGVDFSEWFNADGQRKPHLTREGGHSHRRVIHAEDATGRVVENTLITQARAHSNITLLEHRVAVDLITERRHAKPQDGDKNRCLGAYVLDTQSEKIETYLAPCVVLATGGANKVYLYTSNPDGSTGDGIAMAWRAGCRIANMEFMQFHPTCLYHPRAKSSLISEAVRGEGGRLLLENGERFMRKFDPRMELAPRDIVARAIDHEMKRTGADHVYLDISHKPADFITHHFPNIHQTCLTFGFDVTREPIPVVPAAHYTCGGVMTDTKGATDLPGLYAIGETAHTGLHGANRMASNSLLECFVFAKAASEDILKYTGSKHEQFDIASWDESRVTDSDEEVVVSHNWDELRRFMWDYVGIVRTDKRLARAQHRVDLLISEIDEYYSYFRVTPDLLELRNLTTVAKLIIQSAMLRKESRGLHYTLDYPEPSKNSGFTILTPLNAEQFRKKSQLSVTN